MQSSYVGWDAPEPRPLWNAEGVDADNEVTQMCGCTCVAQSPVQGATGAPNNQAATPTATQGMSMGDAIATSAVQRSDRTRDERQREASAQAERGAKMLRPVQSGSIGTEFGVAGRMWSSGYHTGVDFRVGTGTPIRAAQTGRVVETTSSGPYGNSIVIDHGNGIRTRYAHQSKLLVGKGDVVQAGERIGLSGATGNVTGPHLHFEVLKNGKTVAPGPYLSGQRTL